MHRYGIPQPIWQQIGSKTLATITKLDVIFLTESQRWFWSQSLWNTNDKNGFKSFLMFVTFQDRGLYHLDMYCTLIIEAGLKSNIHFGCRYLELWNACRISWISIVLNVRDGNKSIYPSIVFLSIFSLKKFVNITELVHEISNNVIYATSKASDQPAHTRSLISVFSSRLSILRL